uniref:Uncharacterized protein n=1 Tax=Amphimedon queenslandica TaxID=400682 RepID=A0A1X7TN33_AMPQE
SSESSAFVGMTSLMYGYESSNWTSPSWSSPHWFPYVPPVPTSYLDPDRPLSHQHQRPYDVKLLNDRIKKCRGCGGDFVRKADGSLPDPPMNLVTCHEETRPFWDDTNAICQSKL